MKKLYTFISFYLKRIRRKIFGRQFPKIKKNSRAPKTPISFVVVKFSDEFQHNILASTDVNNQQNELITIDNFCNLNYDSLAQAMNAGINKAKNELIVIVHEDTFLPDGWQTELEAAIEDIEKNDSNWGIIGVAGLDTHGKPAGHYSDPNNFCNTFKKKQMFVEAISIDEHLMIFRKKLNPTADENIVGIHGIGTDMVLTSIKNGNKCYIVNAPSIHKFKNANGEIIKKLMDSPKIADRLNFAYKADKACCDEYISRKWDELTPFDSIVTHYEKWKNPNVEINKFPKQILEILDSPIILLGKGGGGSRLLSLITSDCGVFLGNNVNISGDCMDIVIEIYQALIEKYKCKAKWQKEIIVPQIRRAAAKMLNDFLKKNGGFKNKFLWGFKLPENLLLIPELNAAFPNARYIHMLRDPVETSLRRTHMTARLDNQIGRVTLPLAYRSAGLDVKQILSDPPEIHNAYTTLFQLKNALEFCKNNFNSEKYYELTFDDILNSPEQTRDNLCNWLGAQPAANKTAEEIDVSRAKKPKENYPQELVEKIKKILQPILTEQLIKKL